MYNLFCLLDILLCVFIFLPIMIDYTKDCSGKGTQVPFDENELLMVLKSL